MIHPHGKPIGITTGTLSAPAPAQIDTAHSGRAVWHRKPGQPAEDFLRRVRRQAISLGLKSVTFSGRRCPSITDKL